MDIVKLMFWIPRCKTDIWDFVKIHGLGKTDVLDLFGCKTDILDFEKCFGLGKTDVSDFVK